VTSYEDDFFRVTTKIAHHASILDEYLETIGGCGDGGCIILKPVGQHTNGGCRCSRDPIKMQRFAYAMNRFADEVKASI